MIRQEVLGRSGRARITRISSSGAMLALLDDGGALLEGAAELPLARSEVPSGAGVGDELEIFVHLDSEERLVGTTVRPRLRLDEVAFLEVTDLTTFGAFVDWGLGKELLLPKAEQTSEVHIGRRYPIGLFIDESGRLAGTMRVREMLSERGDFRAGEWVEGEAWREEPGLGVFVIVERRYLGLLPADEPHRLSRGEPARFRVARVLHDGKIELSMRAPAHEQQLDDAAAILRALAATNAAPLLDDGAPEEIRARFGLSKKAFKRAVGGLLKQGAVRIEADGRIVLVAASSSSPPRVR